MTKPSRETGLAPADAVDLKGSGCGMHRTGFVKAGQSTGYPRRGGHPAVCLQLIRAQSDEHCDGEQGIGPSFRLSGNASEQRSLVAPIENHELASAQVLVAEVALILQVILRA